MKHQFFSKTVVFTMAILIAFTMTSCSKAEIIGDIALFGVLAVILVIFARFFYLNIMSPRRLAGKTIYLLREDNDDETWFFIDSSHVLVTSKDGITKKYVYRILRDGKLLIEHYRNNDVVLIDAQNIWQNIINGETRKEVLISNIPTIMAGSLYANRGEISRDEYVQNAVLEDCSHGFFNVDTRSILILILTLSIVLMLITYVNPLLDMSKDMSKVLLSAITFGQKIPEYSVVGFSVAILVGTSIMLYFLWLYVSGLGLGIGVDVIEKRATEAYYEMLREKGKLTPEAQLEHLRFEKTVLVTEYADKRTSSKMRYMSVCKLLVLVLVFVLSFAWCLFGLGWLVEEKIDTMWIQIVIAGAGFLISFLLSGYLANVAFKAVLSKKSVVDIRWRARKEWYDMWGEEYERKEQELKEKIKNSETAENEQQ